MAQSYDGSLIDDRELDTSFHRDDLPEGEAQLVFHENGVTTVMQSDAEEIERQFHERLVDELDTTAEELETVEEYPMPDPLDDEPISE